MEPQPHTGALPPHPAGSHGSLGGGVGTCHVRHTALPVPPPPSGPLTRTGYPFNVFPYVCPSLCSRKVTRTSGQEIDLGNDSRTPRPRRAAAKPYSGAMCWAFGGFGTSMLQSDAGIGTCGAQYESPRNNPFRSFAQLGLPLGESDLDFFPHFTNFIDRFVSYSPKGA